MEQAWVYMLLCGSAKKIYIGWTNDLDKRLAAHQSGRGAKFTRANQPVEMVAAKQCKSRSEAMSFEAQLKKLNRQQRLQWICEHPIAEYPDA